MSIPVSLGLLFLTVTDVGADDTLIGLELQNRLPILKILTSDHFKHYQIFLLTHDVVWYDLARAYLR